MKLIRYAPLKFQLGTGNALDHAILERAHLNRQLDKLGKLRDKASGERRKALNEALRIILTPRRFVRMEMQKTIRLYQR